MLVNVPISGFVFRLLSGMDMTDFTITRIRDRESGQVHVTDGVEGFCIHFDFDSRSNLFLAESLQTYNRGFPEYRKKKNK